MSIFLEKTLGFYKNVFLESKKNKLPVLEKKTLQAGHPPLKSTAFKPQFTCENGGCLPSYKERLDSVVILPKRCQIPLAQGRSLVPGCMTANMFRWSLSPCRNGREIGFPQL